jgi:hypothetical protein
MKIIITQQQFNTLKESREKKVSCSKCDHSWKIEKKDKHPHLCHMCGYDSKSKKYNYEELENFWKGYKKEEVTEKWSEKYKKSINCNNPKGFSQRAHCQSRKKRLKEDEEDSFWEAKKRNITYFKNRFDLDKIKQILKIASKLSVTFGEMVPLTFTADGFDSSYQMRGIVFELFIDVDYEGKEYKPETPGVFYEIKQELLKLFQMSGISESGWTNLDLKFNKKNLGVSYVEFDK